jgi:hypothetical protein
LEILKWKWFIEESGGTHLRLVYWLPVVDEVRTRIYGISRENMIPKVFFNTGITIVGWTPSCHDNSS